jgi:Tfp pilus assembly protein PilF
MHHMSDHTSMKAHALYQIALTLQSTVPMPTDSESLLLHVAVLNNYGVWCFHNHDYDSMKSCFEEMEYMIDESTWSSDGDVTLKIHDTTRNGFLRNLRMFVNDSMH